MLNLSFCIFFKSENKIIWWGGVHKMLWHLEKALVLGKMGNSWASRLSFDSEVHRCDDAESQSRWYLSPEDRKGFAKLWTLIEEISSKSQWTRFFIFSSHRQYSWHKHKVSYYMKSMKVFKEVETMKNFLKETKQYLFSLLSILTCYHHSKIV